MRNFVITILALIIGFLLGIKLSEWIGIAGGLGFGRVIGIKYLPIYIAIALAILANLMDVLLQRGSRKV